MIQDTAYQWPTQYGPTRDVVGMCGSTCRLLVHAKLHVRMLTIRPLSYAQTCPAGYWYAPGWKRYLQRLRDERAARESLASGCCGPEGHGPCTAGGAGGSCSGCPGLAEARLSMDQVLAARSSLDHGAGAGAGTATGTGTGTGSMLRPSASGTARHTSICGGVGSSGGPGAERRSSLSLSTVCAMKRMAAAAHRSAALRVAANKRPRWAAVCVSPGSVCAMCHVK